MNHNFLFWVSRYYLAFFLLKIGIQKSNASCLHPILAFRKHYVKTLVDKMVLTFGGFFGATPLSKGHVVRVWQASSPSADSVRVGPWRDVHTTIILMMNFVDLTSFLIRPDWRDP